MKERICLIIDKDLYRKFKAIAVTQDKKYSEMIEEFIKNIVNSNKQ